MKWRGIWRSALIMTLSIALIMILFIAGIIGFTIFAYMLSNDSNFSTNDIDAALVQTADGYQFDAADVMDENHLWAMLIADDGHVVWNYAKPDDVPDTYTLEDVASFARWYLNDYPVRTRIRDDGLLIIGAPKYSLQRYAIEIGTGTLVPSLLWFGGLFLLMLVGVLVLSALLLRRWFRKDQQRIDAARADWINGVSHDIRTPLSLVMGSAAQLENDTTLNNEARQKATLIRRQSQTIRDLVGDLNLTMRLESSMQVLRREPVALSSFLRQTVADFINSGMADGYPLDMDLPDTPLQTINADPQLLRRALTNLLNNGVRHNPPGCRLRIGAAPEGRCCMLYVESDAPASAAHIGKGPEVGADGLAAHGTGLKLVRQIAEAHGGSAVFSDGDCFRCELRLPLK